MKNKDRIFVLLLVLFTNIHLYFKEFTIEKIVNPCGDKEFNDKKTSNSDKPVDYQSTPINEPRYNLDDLNEINKNIENFKKNGLNYDSLSLKREEVVNYLLNSGVTIPSNNITNEPVVEESIKRDETPVVTEEEPTKIDEIPVITNEEPIKIDETPVVTDEESTKIDETPVVTDEESTKIDETPVVIEDNPGDALESPNYPSITPTEDLVKVTVRGVFWNE